MKSSVSNHCDEKTERVIFILLRKKFSEKLMVHKLWSMGDDPQIATKVFSAG